MIRKKTIFIKTVILHQPNFLGSLPWQGILTPSIKEKYKRIKNAKIKLSLEVLCQVKEQQTNFFEI